MPPCCDRRGLGSHDPQLPGRNMNSGESGPDRQNPALAPECGAEFRPGFGQILVRRHSLFRKNRSCCKRHAYCRIQITVPLRRGPPSECTHVHLAPDTGYNTPQPRRSPLSWRFWLCLYIFGLHLFVVSLSSSWRVVLSCVSLRPPDVTRGPKIFQDVTVIVSTAGVASRRHPGARLALPPSFPTWGLDPLRRETSTATVAIHASGGGAAPPDRGLTP